MRSVNKNTFGNKSTPIVETDVNELLSITDLSNMSRMDIMTYRHKLHILASQSMNSIDILEKILNRIEEVDKLVEL